MPTTEAAIDNGITRDVYLVIGDRQVEARQTLTINGSDFSSSGKQVWFNGSGGS